MNAHISMITLGVEDIARSLDFYQNGLLFPRFEFAQNKNVVFFSLEGAWLSIYPYKLLAQDCGSLFEGFGKSAISISHNVTSQSEVDSLIRLAGKAGAHISKKPSKASWGGYTGYFLDPDSYIWGVIYNPFFTPGSELIPKK